MSRARRPGLREAVLAAVIAALVLAISSWLVPGTALRTLETLSLDLRFRLRGPLRPGADVVLVMVDDRSLAALGRWPLSRLLYADAVTRLDRVGAKVIVFDMLFPEPEQPLPPALRTAVAAAVPLLPAAIDPATRRTLAAAAVDDPDAAFATSMRRSGRVLLPIGFTFRGPAIDADLSDAGYLRFDPSAAKPAVIPPPSAAILPIAPLAAAAAGLGHISWRNDQDGVPHYDPLALPFAGDFIPSMPVRAVAAWLGVPWDQVGLALGERVRIGPLTVPTDQASRLLINYLGPPGTVPTYSFVDLLRGGIPASAVAGRIVLLGGSFTGSNDSYPSPYGGLLLPGTERIADTIETMLSRRFIAPAAPGWLAVAALAVVTAAALMAALSARLPGRISPLPGLVTVAIWLAICQAAFTRGVWLPLVGPTTALLAATAAAVVFRYGVVERDGRRVRSAFRQYMAPEMVEVLANHPERLRLGGETRRMSFLFCDIRGFTTLAEPFREDPQGLIRLINGFLTPMTDVIMARRGTIDKYMGDCIMAFWNAPLDDPGHADHACEAALAMLAALDALNSERAQANPGTAPLAIGIGINTGSCVVGNMGSARRFDYSVIGDAVNLASRLEGQSKTYGVAIVIGEETRAAAPGWATLELDRIAVKGKREAVRVFALLGDAAMAASPEFARLVAGHEAMLTAYRRQDWRSAQAALDASRVLHPAFAVLHDLYAARIVELEANPPGADWDGVHIATSK